MSGERALGVRNLLEASGYLATKGIDYLRGKSAESIAAKLHGIIYSSNRPKARAR